MLPENFSRVIKYQSYRAQIETQFAATNSKHDEVTVDKKTESIPNLKATSTTTRFNASEIVDAIEKIRGEEVSFEQERKIKRRKELQKKIIYYTTIGLFIILFIVVVVLIYRSLS